MDRERVLSCIQPTGKGELHIGNYFGAIRNWVEMQNSFDCIYGIVDYHAITVNHNSKQLPEFVLEMAMDLLACGIDPEKAILFVQSHVPEHTELAWIFDCVASYGELTRMVQFKEKGKDQEFVSVGLFNYPVLQAADILIYKATVVPVGQDQDQHIELTRDIAKWFNNRFGEVFPLPLTGSQVRENLAFKGAKILSLADPTKKMGKSYGSKHYVGIMESEDSIYEKIKSAVTDPGPGREHEYMSPGVETLFSILELTAPTNTYQSFEDKYRNKSLKYKELKDAVFEHLMIVLTPIRKRKRELADSRKHVIEVLEFGAKKARAIAQETMMEVRHMVGVGPHSIKS